MQGERLQKKKSEALFFARTPPLQSLCMVFITVPSQQVKNGSVNSFQPNTIKCRELIFTEPDILASPLLGKGAKVQIIMQIKMYKSGRLQQRLQKMNVEVSQPKRVTSSDYQCCLKYTVLAKLAPLWNKVGAYLAQGREFVISTQKINAVNMDLTVNEEELYLQLKPTLIRVPPIQLKDLNVSPRVLEVFMNQRADVDIKLDEYELGHRWCHILPSMKKGQIVNILRKIPEDCPFKSYKDVKKYWKNMYGYRLPETDEGMLYYQIFFRPLSHTLFTYPECCIRLQDVGTFNAINSDEIMQQFLTDIHSKLPVLCGEKLEFRSQAMYTVPQLMEADQESKENHPNLRSPIETKQERTQEQRINPYTPWKASLATPSNQNQSTSLQPSNHNTQQESGLANCYNRISRENEMDTQCSNNAKILRQNTEDIAEKKANDTNVGKQRIVPIFKPKPRVNSVYNTNKSSAISANRLVPVFKAQNKHNLTEANSHRTSGDMFSDMELLKAKLDGAAQYNSKNQIDNETEINNSVNCMHFASGNQASKKKAIVAPNIGFQKRESQTPNFQNLKHLAQSQKVGTWSNNTVESAGVDHVKTLKRPAIEEHPGESKPKKPKQKPKVQEGIDIEALARVNQLGKVNTITLASWLKSKGVPCKSREKKNDLVDKVSQLLHLNIVEQ